MRVTVLGSAASHAAEGQACAGHLVECDDTQVLFDCGNGVLANLYRVADPLAIEAVFVTHNHPDHYVDLYSMQSMLRYAPSGPAPAVPLFMPEALYERMQLLLSERGALEFREAFVFRPLEHGKAVTVGCLTVTPLLVDHTEPTFALVAECGARRFSYTSDTAPGPRAHAAAEGADLLIAEATLPEQWAGASPHMTARQAGELGRDAGVGQLVLAHVWPSNDREVMQREAEEAFGRSVTIANEFDVFDVG